MADRGGKFLFGRLPPASWVQRDQFSGRDEKTRPEYLARLLNNSRFLILTWIKRAIRLRLFRL
jgi:hypothetical protein